MSCRSYCGFILLVPYVLVFGLQTPFQSRLLTSVRHGLDLNFRYIDQNYDKMNSDCFIGVSYAIAFLQDAFKNGSHFMDASTVSMLNKARYIVQKFKTMKLYYEDHLAQNFVEEGNWKKSINYISGTLYRSMKPDYSVIKIMTTPTDYAFKPPTTNDCFLDIFHAAQKMKEHSYEIVCKISKECWDKYLMSTRLSSQYVLTHELMLWQVLKDTNCVRNVTFYEIKIRDYCSRILTELYNVESFNMLDDFFDLFMEQIVLCGYQGRTEFLKYRHIYYILKSQRPTGCFHANLKDHLKSSIKRKKRDINDLADGCADHTTGLGASIFALFYNYIIKENVSELDMRFIY